METYSNATENLNTNLSSDNHDIQPSSSQDQVNQLPQPTNQVHNSEQAEEDDDDDRMTEVSFECNPKLNTQPPNLPPALVAHMRPRAFRFLHKVRGRFKDNDATFSAFFRIIKDSRQKNARVKVVYNRIRKLFRRHDDLVEDFTYFLPGQTAPP